MRGPISDDELRAMYAGGRANPSARRFARVWGAVFASGISPRRWVRLEVPGRRTGRIQRIPIGLAEVDRRWYAVSMLGECNWVRNARANGDRVVLRHLVASECSLHEVPDADRAPILRRYLEVAPGGRPHIPATATSSDAELTAIAGGYPVFELVDPDGAPYTPSRSWAPAALVAVGLVLVAGRARRRSRARGDSLPSPG